MEERAYLYYLYSAPGVGAKSAARLLDAFGSASEIYRRFEKAAGLLGARAREGFITFSRAFSPQEEYERLMDKGISFTAMPLPDYPVKLKNIADPPFGLTWAGRLPDEKKPAVAVIGARMCSEYGRYMASRFGSELAAAGVQVISGMAVGIDGLSQSACVRAGGESFAILGSGADVCYPNENRELYESLKRTGGVISENPPGTKPRAGLFPMRNRLISAFSDAVLVIEARRRSGTLITADMALEQGKDVFALPGRATDALSEGCNRLIKQGAGAATCVSDITEALFGPGAISGANDDEVFSDRQISLSRDERLIVRYLDIEPRSVNEIADSLSAAGASMDVTLIMELLVDLCLKGVCVREGGCFSLRPACRRE